jgi:hypothetical protein
MQTVKVHYRFVTLDGKGEVAFYRHKTLAGKCNYGTCLVPVLCPFSVDDGRIEYRGDFAVSAMPYVQRPVLGRFGRSMLKQAKKYFQARWTDIRTEAKQVARMSNEDHLFFSQEMVDGCKKRKVVRGCGPIDVEIDIRRCKSEYIRLAKSRRCQTKWHNLTD